MRILSAALMWLLLTTGPGANHLDANQGFDPTTPDGGAVASIQKESDPQKKDALLEDFVKTYPDSSMVGWAWGQLQGTYLKTQQYDKALEAGQKALATNPDAVEIAYDNLKAAEAKDDPDTVAKWSAETSRAARKEAAKPGLDAARVDYDKQVDTYTEYSLYATSLKMTDNARIIELTESLEQRSPQSVYLSKAYGRYLSALRQSGQNDKASEAAARELERDPMNEDVLLVAADSSMQRKDLDKLLQYSTKLAQVMETKPHPEEVSDADWQKKRHTLLTMAYWMQGVSDNGQTHYSDADKALRKALPFANSDDRLNAVVLFQLGVADFQLGKSLKSSAMLKDALRFSQQSAALKSPVQMEAQNNAKAISRALGTTH